MRTRIGSLRRLGVWRGVGLPTMSWRESRGRGESATANLLVYFRVHAREGSLAVEAKLAVLAEYAGVSSDNRLNILGIFEEVPSRTFPATVPHIYAVLSCEADPTEYGKKFPARVALLDADSDDNEILALEGLIEVPPPGHQSERVTVNQIVGLTSVHFDHPGNYRFSFSIEGEEIASVPLRANKVE